MGIWIPELCITLFSFIVTLNFIEVCCIVRRIRSPGQCIPYQHILLSLGISDFLIGVNGFLTVWEFYNPQIYVLCGQLRATALFSIQFLTLDRVLAVFRPFDHKRILSLTRVRFIIAAYWILSMVSGITLFRFAFVDISLMPIFRRTVASVMMVLAVIQVISYSAIYSRLIERRKFISPGTCGKGRNENIIQNYKAQSCVIKKQIQTISRETSTTRCTDLDPPVKSVIDSKNDIPYEEGIPKLLYLDIEKIDTSKVCNFNKDAESKALEVHRAKLKVPDSYDYSFPSPETYRQQQRELIFQVKSHCINRVVSNTKKPSSPLDIMRKQEKRVFYIALSYCVSFCFCLLPLSIAIVFFSEDLAYNRGNLGVVYILAYAFSIFNPCIYFVTNHKKEIAILKQHFKGKLHNFSKSL